MKRRILDFIRKQPRWRLGVAALGILFCAAGLFRGSKTATEEITFVARQGDLPITVLSSGSIEALESQEIRSEVKGVTKLLKIIEEGYQVTEDDVKNGKVLVELDSSEIRDRLVQEEIEYESALASLTDAGQAYEIQRNQNISNIKAAEQKAQFARMDLEKFLSDRSANEIIKILGLDEMETAIAKLASIENIEQLMLSALETSGGMAITNASEISTNSQQTLSELQKPAEESKAQLIKVSVPTLPVVTNAPVIEYAAYAKDEALGDGSAMQQLRKLRDDLQSGQQQAGLSSTRLTGTRRLFEKGYATKTELDTDTISYENNQLKVKTAETALNLFLKYEFPKQAQEFASKYEESLRGLEREKKEAISKLAQSRARLKGAESRYRIQSEQRKTMLEQMAKCVIKAQRPGLVVYGGSSSDFYGNQEQIREGASIRERQPIITIPDMSKMAVRIKVHETYIQKICKGLKAKIRVDAYPNEELTGEVSKVALLPDSQNRWINPDMKVYQTVVSIDGSHAWLKPGMSAKVEIMVKQLNKVIYVPLQAIHEINDKQYVQVISVTSERRAVEIGEFNDEFIEIKKGLKVGEKVSLRTPDTDPNDVEQSGSGEKKTDGKGSKKSASGQKPDTASRGKGGTGKPAERPAGGRPSPAK